MRSRNRSSLVKGTGATTSETGAQTIAILTGVANKRIRVTKAILSVKTAGDGASSVTLRDGSTVIYKLPNDSVQVRRIDFGPTGYPLGVGNSLNLQVDLTDSANAVTRCTAVGLILS